MLGWLGLGWAVDRALRPGGGVRGGGATWAVWGMAVTLAAGGVLNLLRWTSVTVVGWGTLLAALAGAYVIARRLGEAVGGRVRFGFAILPLAVAGVAIYLAAAASTAVNPIDDELKYLVFPRQMLETGTLIAPFHLHRLGTYGGQQFLQAQIIATAQVLFGAAGGEASAAHVHLLDEGMCLVVGAGVLWAIMQPRRRWQGLLALAGCCLFWLVPIARANVHAQASGIVLFLALLQLLAGAKFSWRGAVMVGLVGAAVASLRVQFLAVGIVILVAGMWGRKGSQRFGLSAVALGMMALALLPWAVVMYESSGTLLYPLMRGFQQGTVAMWDHAMPLVSRVEMALRLLLYPKVIFLFLPPLLIRRWPRREAQVACVGLYAAALAATLAIGWSMPVAGTTNFYRLASPLLLAASCGALAMSVHQWRFLTLRTRVATAVLALAMPWVLGVEYSDLFFSSYPLYLVALVLLVTWPLKRPVAEWLVHFLLIVGLMIWGLENARLMFNNCGLFAVAGAFVGLGWIAWSVRPLALRVFAGVAAGIVLIAASPGLVLAFSGPLVACMFVLALALAGLRAVASGAVRRRRFLLAVALAAVAICVAAFQRDFLFDDSAPIAIVAAMAVVAWILFHARAKSLRAVALLWLTLAMLLGVPTLAASHDAATELGVACGAAVLAGLVLIASSMQMQNIAATVIVAGLVPLGIEHVRHLDTLLRDGTSVASVPADDIQNTYWRAQEVIPAGAKVLVLVAQPARLDYARNEIDVIDDVHAYVSPPPGMPMSAGPLREYLAGLGIRYVIISGAAEQTADEQYSNGVWLPLNQLRQTRHVLYQSPYLVVLDLATEAAQK